MWQVMFVALCLKLSQLFFDHWWSVFSLSVWIKVIFKNKASRPYSFHLQGVYDRSQGAGIAQTHSSAAPSGVPGEPVAPGEARTYNWRITKKQGPTDTEFDCKTGAYYSTVDKVCIDPAACSSFIFHTQTACTVQCQNLCLCMCCIIFCFVLDCSWENSVFISMRCKAV